LRNKFFRLYQTQLNDFLHVDCISDLGWSIYKVNNNLKVLLVSSSVDGKILMWDMSDKMRYPKRGYLLERTIKGVNTKVSSNFLFF
jgi:WD40 repeat protein